jgi:hypothetical protein
MHPSQGSILVKAAPHANDQQKTASHLHDFRIIDLIALKCGQWGCGVLLPLPSPLVGEAEIQAVQAGTQDQYVGYRVIDPQ